MKHSSRLKAALAALLLFVSFATAARAGAYVQTNLVSDQVGVALNRDTNLINPWGFAYSNTSPVWVGDQGTSVSTLYSGINGTPVTTTVVPIPTGTGLSGPTGVVNNGTQDFRLTTPNTNPATFIFATLNGTIAG
jgi:hypothetical protein